MVEFESHKLDPIASKSDIQENWDYSLFELIPYFFLLVSILLLFVHLKYKKE